MGGNLLHPELLSAIRGDLARDESTPDSWSEALHSSSKSPDRMCVNVPLFNRANPGARVRLTSSPLSGILVYAELPIVTKWFLGPLSFDACSNEGLFCWKSGTPVLAVHCRVQAQASPSPCSIPGLGASRSVLSRSFEAKPLPHPLDWFVFPGQEELSTRVYAKIQNLREGRRRRLRTRDSGAWTKSLRLRFPWGEPCCTLYRRSLVLAHHMIIGDNSCNFS